MKKIHPKSTLEASWEPLGASWGHLGGALGEPWRFLGASWHLGAVLGASWERLGVVLVGNMAPTWLPTRSPNPSKIETKINQFFNAS